MQLKNSHEKPGKVNNITSSLPVKVNITWPTPVKILHKIMTLPKDLLVIMSASQHCQPTMV